ncbi:MAG: hypothetical protein PVF74_11465, partial [Anaerolineales bacterium]
MDGEILKPDYKISQEFVEGEPLLQKVYVYNFPYGLTGVHDFVGHYYGPCYLYSDDCRVPHQPVEVLTEYQTITFVDADQCTNGWTSTFTQTEKTFFLEVDKDTLEGIMTFIITVGRPEESLQVNVTVNSLY